MASLCRVDINQTEMLRCPVSLRCKNIVATLDGSHLLDTGAGICHMSFMLWCQLGFNMVCYEGNKELFDNIGISSPDEMTFDSLPLQPKTTALGDYKEVTVYEFKLDELTLGERSIGYPAITLNDITVKIINSDEYSFIIGWNVLRYLSVEYAPSAADSGYRLMLDDKGKRLLEAHRNRGVNGRQSTFDYLEPSAAMKSVLSESDSMILRYAFVSGILVADNTGFHIHPSVELTSEKLDSLVERGYLTRAGDSYAVTEKAMNRIRTNM